MDAERLEEIRVSTIVVYCPRCDYHLNIAAAPGGTHGCARCGGQMAVFVPQELMYAPNGLLAEVERLRGVVEAAKAESAFEVWWNADVPTPPMPEIDLYPTTPLTPRRIYFGPNNRGTAWAAWRAALTTLEAKP